MKTITLTYNELSALCLELALFLHAGADFGGALSLLAEETDAPQVKARIADMAAEVDEGTPLSDAMEHSGLFPWDVWAMVRVGERTGRTEETLHSLSRYYTRRDAADQQIRSALLYPSLLMLVMLAVIVILLAKVLPIFREVYASLGAEMTGLAGTFLQFGLVLDALLPLLCLLAGIISCALAAFAVLPSLRRKCISAWNRRFGGKGLSARTASARFAQAFSLGIASGLTAEEAVEISADLLSDQPAAQKRCQDCLSRLAEGMNVADALRQSGLFPAAECRLLQLGIQSGNSALAAAELATRLENAAEYALEQRISRIEPLMVGISSLLIGIILLTVMLPLTRIMTAIG